MPLSLVQKNLVASKAINSDWLDQDIGPFKSSTVIRISVFMAAGGIINVQMKNGGVTTPEQLNKAVALTANSRQDFDIIMGPSDSFNVQHSSGGTQNISVRAFELPRQ